MGGVDDVQTIRDKALGPGLLHHLVEEALEALGPKTLAETAQGGVIEQQFPGAQTQKALKRQIPSGPFFQSAIRKVIAEPQKTSLTMGTGSQGARPQSM